MFGVYGWGVETALIILVLNANAPERESRHRKWWQEAKDQGYHNNSHNRNDDDDDDDDDW